MTEHIPEAADRSTQEHSMATSTTEESGLHPVNTGHLVLGIAFAGLVAIWALITGDVVSDDQVQWLIPVPWVVAGAVGLVVATAASFRSKPAPETVTTYAPEPTGGPAPADYAACDERAEERDAAEATGAQHTDTGHLDAAGPHPDTPEENR